MTLVSLVFLTSDLLYADIARYIILLLLLC